MPVALLHSGHAVTWTAWRIEPSIIAGAAIAVALYLYGLRYAGPAFSSWRPPAFAAGLLLVLLALLSPLDAASERLLSMHMLQHVVLATLAPPLVLLGLPPQALRRLLPLGSAGFRALATLTTPFLAGALFILNMWAWHLPPAYQAALEHLPVHIAMHLAFLGTGLIFWWPIIAPLPEMSRAGAGARLLYLFVTGFPMGILALLLLSSQTVLYDFYKEQPDQLWGIAPLDDQQIAGVIMGGLGEAASFIAFSLIFVRFLLSDEAESAPPAGAQLSVTNSK